jgi:hypothetical protein
MSDMEHSKENEKMWNLQWPCSGSQSPTPMQQHCRTVLQRPHKLSLPLLHILPMSWSVVIKDSNEFDHHYTHLTIFWALSCSSCQRSGQVSYPCKATGKTTVSQTEMFNIRSEAFTASGCNDVFFSGKSYLEGEILILMWLTAQKGFNEKLLQMRQMSK